MRTRGFTLLEAVVALTLSAALATVLARTWIALGLGARAMTATAEEEAVWWNARRVLAADLHTAVQASADTAGLRLVTADGRVYRYTVNSQGQLVRTAVGGGTAVIAVGVASASFTVSSGVDVRLSFRSGVERTWYAATLAGIGL
ncbi:MAG: prepilin-type N-terminal cleavage/methylation domain-containing protein [Alicyclobacillus macrosporangiidus]|uniref:PulJ/GspJ family protein n=1 Tax=Alicyclobacillus macrosporangiidus TaxID=392015 RepID=UPI0026F10645|nr:prepilin-type N-terminal cleavage/methylation domain-containing protein [Alicyclobacillus macrosporangiidus]MCL6598463.1 prepilin-type N-terminal cleavage/methylation domain-containing protein [Alicyclobacillus macrosporangiidus]